MSEHIGVDDPLAYWRDRKEIAEQVDRDPLAPGITHGGQHVKDVARALNTLIHRDNYRKVTIEVEACPDDYHISFTVKERK